MESSKIQLFIATKAFIRYRGKILILKESLKYNDGSNTGKFDVAGGRVELGQNFEKSLLREIKEETGLEVKIGKPFFVGEWRPKIRNKQWQIVGVFFECFAKSSKVKLSKDHESFQWIDPRQFGKFPIIPNLKEAFKNYLQKI